MLSQYNVSSVSRVGACYIVFFLDDGNLITLGDFPWTPCSWK